MEPTVDTKPVSTQGSPYGREQYGTTLYGQETLEDRSTTVRAHFQTIGSMSRVVHTKYRVKARYSGKEATLEDVYTYSTKRYMMLGCLDGPFFPFHSSTSKEEVSV